MMPPQIGMIAEADAEQIEHSRVHTSSPLRQTLVTESISAFASATRHFSRSRWLRSSECSR